MTTARAAAAQSLGLGPHTFPPSPTSGPSGFREGGCTVSVETSQNVDQGKASGTDKARTTLKGKAPAKVKISLWWTHRIADLVDPMIQAWDPNGPGNGGPFRIVHPKTDQRRVTDVVVEKMGDVEEMAVGGWYRVALDCEEWNPPPKPKPGSGSKTPKKSEEWQSDGASSPGGPNPLSGYQDGIEGVIAAAEAALRGAQGPNAGGGASGVGGANGPDDKP